MRTQKPAAGALLAATLLAASCGLENFTALFPPGNTRPSSRILGATSWVDPTPAQLGVTDGDGNALAPFTLLASNSAYEVRLPSSQYSMIMIRARVGNMALRALIPSIGEETTISGIDLDARAMTEVLIVEARLSADGQKFKQVTSSAYLGTRKLIRAAMEVPGPTKDLLGMVQRLMTKGDPTSTQIDPDFFAVPVLSSTFEVTTSPLSLSWIARNGFDYVGDGKFHNDTAPFDAALAQVAQQFRPAGCPDPDHIRLVFTVDFNQGGKNGNCASIDRFKWATDKPGKQMFFVGWIHKDSDIQDPAVNNLLGASTPNQIAMFDDGTNGDEVAGDHIYTISFVVPRSSAGHALRIGYKYTWGTRGAPWTGSEEWPGNSRILEGEDLNGDGFVYRRDIFGDEATNKDNSNLNQGGTGSITWTTDLHACGVPEARENKYDNATCGCGAFQTPKSIGPITVDCSK